MISLVRAIVTAWILCQGVFAFPWGFGMSDTIAITLTITDEEGKPVPHVTVWGYHLPRCNGAEVLALDGEDLWRHANRYRDSFEFASHWNPIVREQWITPMGDAKGEAKIVLDYGDMNGKSQKRPPEMKVGFVALKRGYFPARVDFAVKKESKLKAQVVLKRDPSQALETQPYLMTYERLRFELSDWERFTAIKESTDTYINRLRTEFEAAAQQALAVGDKPAAARMYARMQYLPAIVFINGKPAGFKQSDVNSVASRAFMVKAYELDPSNPYIAAWYLNYHRRFRSDEERRKALEVLMKTSGEAIWPDHHFKYVLQQIDKDDLQRSKAKANPMLDELHRWEPRFQTREMLQKRFDSVLAVIFGYSSPRHQKQDS